MRERGGTVGAAERAAGAVFAPLAWGTAALHALFALTDLFVGPSAAGAMSPVDAGVVGVVGLIVLFRRRGMSATLGTFLLFGANVAVGLVRLAVGGLPILGAPLLLLQLAVASLLYSRRSILALELAILAGWIVISASRATQAAWLPWHFVILSGSVVALVLTRTRLQLFERAERHRASLQESEARYRALVESAPDGICVLVDGRIVFANAAALRIWGASRPEELVGRRGIALIAPESASLVAQRNRAVEREGVTTCPIEVTGRRLDGRSVELEIWGLPVHYEGRNADLSVVRDISARKEAQRQQERLLEVSAEQAVTRDLVRRMLSEARRGASMRDLGRSLAQDVPALDVGDYARAFEAMGFGSIELRASADGRYELRGRDLLERLEESAQPTCDIALGFLEGAVARLEGAEVLGTETRCQSQGHEACTFVLRTRRAAPLPRALELPRTIGKRS